MRQWSALALTITLSGRHDAHSAPASALSIASTGGPRCSQARCSALLAFTNWTQFLAHKVARRSFRKITQRAEAGIPDPFVERLGLKLKSIQPGSVASAFHCLCLSQQHEPTTQAL